MAEEISEEKSKEKIKVASEGDKIKVVKGEAKGKEGTVLMVRENSVIIQISTNQKTGEPVKTVVNHKNYKITK